MAESSSPPTDDPYAAPRKPGAPELLKPHHVLHLLITVVLVVATFGTVGWLWVGVWIFQVAYIDWYNRREVRDYEGAMARYRADVLSWQRKCKAELGWVPQLPE